MSFLKIWLRLFAVGAVFLLAQNTAMAAPLRANAPDNECDRIAALRLPFSSTTAVHETQEPDWVRGVAACDAQVKAHPGEIRFVYQRGRRGLHRSHGGFGRDVLFRSWCGSELPDRF